VSSESGEYAEMRERRMEVRRRRGGSEGIVGESGGLPDVQSL
jgi:hypothetical protein